MNKWLVAITFSVLLLVPAGAQNASAGVPVVPVCGDMYGSGGNKGTDPGSIFLVSQADGSQTFIGDPTVSGGLSGLVFDDQIRLWGSNLDKFPGNLIEINPSDGSLINDVGAIKDVFGDVKILDFAFDPVSKQLFGTSVNAQLLTIDRTTAMATEVGLLPASPAHIGFAPDGTLYMVDRNVFPRHLFTLDPTNVNVLTQVVLSEDKELDALGVRGDGTIFAAGTPFFGDGKDIWTIATDGTMSFIGNGERQVADLDFLPCPDDVVGGKIIPIETTSLILAGAQTFSWMLPVILSGIGIGLFVVSRKSE